MLRYTGASLRRASVASAWIECRVVVAVKVLLSLAEVGFLFDAEFGQIFPRSISIRLPEVGPKRAKVAQNWPRSRQSLPNLPEAGRDWTRA